jgi:hypothetical protein
MEEKKTVVWHGGLEALLRSDEPRARPEEPAAQAGGSSVHDALTTAHAVTEVTASHLRRLNEEASEVARTEVFTPAPRVHNLYRPDASGTRVMGSWLAPQAGSSEPSPVVAAPVPQPPSASDPAATRIHPIESLFPTQAEAKSAVAPEPPHEPRRATTADDTAPTAPASSSVTRTDRGLLRSKLRRGLQGERGKRVLLYGVLALVCAMGLTVRLVRARRALDSVAESASETTTAVQVAQAPEVDESANPQVPEPPREPGPALAAPHGLERAAVDALARGDNALAQRIYLELARAPAAPATFHEAARILERNQATDAR